MFNLIIYREVGRINRINSRGVKFHFVLDERSVFSKIFCLSIYTE